MKRGRRVLFILLACGAVAVTAGFVWPREREPEYQGKRLSKWLEGLQTGTGGKEAEMAVRHMGTNGLPFLMKWVGHGWPGWEMRFAGVLPGAIRGNSLVRWVDGEKAFDRGNAAMVGLGLLGAEAGSAVPELCRMAKDKRALVVSQRADIVLLKLSLALGESAEAWQSRQGEGNDRAGDGTNAMHGTDETDVERRDDN